MWKHLYFYVVLFCSKAFSTAGEVWPKPQQEDKGKNVYVLSPATFKFKVLFHNCTLLWKAKTRYEKILKGKEAFDDEDFAYLDKLGVHKILKEIRIRLSKPCESYPHINMDERYFLNVSKVSVLRSKSVWGILRGLETFAQLFFEQNVYKVKQIIATKIVDYPRYAHRGFLIDTARHYLSSATILTHLEAMAMNKYNVLHWHLTDAESFSYQSEKFPELSYRSKYRDYNKKVIKEIVNFAKDRGIRVVPEIEMPAHTLSWGFSHPEVMISCPVSAILNPAINATYDMIGQLIKEMKGLFPDKNVHAGGKDVPFECWIKNKELRTYMNKNNLNTNQLFDQFIKKVRHFLSQKSPIYWEDVFNQGVNLASDSLIQVWRDFRIIYQVIVKGLQVLVSRGWYLGAASKTTLQSAYQTDPRSIAYQSWGFGDAVLDRIRGGEACLWGEHLEERDFHDMAWPRGAAIAEVLWSARDLHATPEVPLNRVREQMSRMQRRAIPLKHEFKILPWMKNPPYEAGIRVTTAPSPTAMDVDKSLVCYFSWLPNNCLK